jgi:hypothetical protein
METVTQHAVSRLCLLWLLLLGSCAAATERQVEEADSPEAACTHSHSGPSAVDASDPRVAQASETCRGDDGECTASVPCIGTVAERVCEVQRLVVSADAAICIAKLHGLTDGVAGISAELVYNHGYRRIVWNVANVTYDRSVDSPPTADGTATGSLDRGGQLFSIDAASGEVLTGFGDAWREIS